MMSSCSIDDDASNTTYELAEITGNDLPDNFILGETYAVNVEYTLPSACNSFARLDASRGGLAGNEKRQIYVGIVSVFNDANNCDPNTPGAEGSSNFSITIDETEDYTFYFWTGTDSNNEPIYSEIVVPVQDQVSSEN